MDYNIQCFSLPSFTLAKWNSQFKALVHLFFLYHSIERIIEVLNFPYYAQHQNVIWYRPKSLMLPQKLPSSSEFNKKSHLRSYPQTPSNYTRPSFRHLYPFPLFLQHSFWSLPLLLTPPCLLPHKNRGGRETKTEKKKKNPLRVDLLWGQKFQSNTDLHNWRNILECVATIWTASPFLPSL